AQAVVPVAEDLLRIGVAAAEQRVVRLGPPDLPLPGLPAAQHLGPGDDRAGAGGGAVGDALVGPQPAQAGADPFPVHAVPDQDGVAGGGQLRRPADLAEGMLRAAVAARRRTAL